MHGVLEMVTGWNSGLSKPGEDAFLGGLGSVLDVGVVAALPVSVLYALAWLCDGELGTRLRDRRDAALVLFRGRVA